MAKPSTDSLSIASVSIPVRPTAPTDLTEYQRQIWDSVTNTKPPEWFEADTYPLLRAYCIAADMHYRITQEAETHIISDPEMKKLLTMQKEQAMLLATLAIKMRLTQQSRYTPQAAATANKKTPSGQKPWES